MGKDRSQYVLSLLESYPQMAREIELMRYELQFSIGISAQEMIEVMSFAKKRRRIKVRLSSQRTGNCGLLQRRRKTPQPRDHRKHVGKIYFPAARAGSFTPLHWLASPQTSRTDTRILHLQT